MFIDFSIFLSCLVTKTPSIYVRWQQAKLWCTVRLDDPKCERLSEDLCFLDFSKKNLDIHAVIRRGVMREKRPLISTKFHISKCILEKPYAVDPTALPEAPAGKRDAAHPPYYSHSLRSSCPLLNHCDWKKILGRILIQITITPTDRLTTE